MPLTVVACTKASTKPDGKPKKLSDSGGLYLLAGKYWRWDYRFNGVRKTMALGVFPEIPLGEAREAHARGRARLREGVDPMAARQEAKQQVEADAANSFRALALEWHSVQSARWAARTAAKAMTQLESPCSPSSAVAPWSPSRRPSCWRCFAG